MYEPEGESDEDNEVYFLKPVNEYNIVEKIKEANKQLFDAENDTNANMSELTADDNEPLLAGDGSNTSGITLVSSSSNTNNNNTTTTSNNNRKVTFALNLEMYEPDNKQNTAEATEDNENSETGSEVGLNKTSASKTIKKSKYICSVIPEEPESELDAMNKPTTVKANFNEEEPLGQQQPAYSGDKEISEQSINDDDTTIEEICEEIILMDIDQETKENKSQNNGIATTETTKARATIQRRNTIIKQATFDYDEQDNKSLINLLTDSDDCDDEYKPLFDINEADNDSLHDELNDITNYPNTDDEDPKTVDHDVENDNDNGDDDDDDEDDDLSLIVASYLPDDYEYTPLTQKTQSNGKTATTTTTTTKKRSYFTKRFSFRRKIAGNNAIGTSCKQHNSANSNRNNRTHNNNNNATTLTATTTTYELNDLKLNYKTCCEYRYAVIDKLPKYTGYLSEYGLSHEQLQCRAQRLQRKKHSVLEQTLRTKESDLRKMQDNERAFTTWLKNKIRYPINKTRNMFDVKTKQRTANNGINKFK